MTHFEFKPIRVDDASAASSALLKYKCQKISTLINYSNHRTTLLIDQSVNQLPSSEITHDHHYSINNSNLGSHCYQQ
jgi:hypothetical protein